MKTSEFLRWLKGKGATFESKRGKGSHIRVTLEGKQTAVPQHSKELKTGTMEAIKKPARNQRREVMLSYGARLKADKDGGFVVTFRDVPEAITQGEDKEDALRRAQEALETAMQFYFDDRREVPMPTPKKSGEHLIDLPVSEALKVLLLNEMVRQHVKPSELAELMHTTKQEVNRLTTLRHTTKLDRIAEALYALGKRLTVDLQVA